MCRVRASQVALNRTDMCIGDFWPTAERRALGATFTIPLMNENLLIVIPKETGTSATTWTMRTLLAEVISIFEPFDWDVWDAFMITGE